MSEYQLAKESYVAVTPAGAYFAATTLETTPARKLLLTLLAMPHTPRATDGNIRSWAGQDSLEEALELLYRVQRTGWVRGDKSMRVPPHVNMDRDVPSMIAALSSEGRALLADMQGFPLTTVGFAHEAAEELARLAADVAALSQHHRGIVNANLGIRSSAWSVVDAAGYSHIGFWPLYLGTSGFMLVLSGEPRFNQPEFADLVWGLTHRYSES